MRGQPASVDTGPAGPPCQNLAKYLHYRCEIKVLDKSECPEKHSLLAMSALEALKYCSVSNHPLLPAPVLIRDTFVGQPL